MPGGFHSFELTSASVRDLALRSCHNDHGSTPQGKRSRQMLSILTTMGRSTDVPVSMLLHLDWVSKKEVRDGISSFPNLLQPTQNTKNAIFPCQCLLSPFSSFWNTAANQTCKPKSNHRKVQCFIRGGQRSGSRRSGGHGQQAGFDVEMEGKPYLWVVGDLGVPTPSDLAGGCDDTEIRDVHLDAGVMSAVVRWTRWEGRRRTLFPWKGHRVGYLGAGLVRVGRKGVKLSRTHTPAKSQHLRRNEVDKIGRLTKDCWGSS